MLVLSTLLYAVLAYDEFEIGGEWLDTSGSFIQGHGGHVSYMPEADCFGNGTKGCWVWYGEDKREIFGFHSYASTDLYNWVDKGMALQVHNVTPEKLNDEGSGIVPDDGNLAELKRRANLDAPEEGVTEQDIKIAHDFLTPYVTEKDAQGKYLKFDEQSLSFAFRYLFKGYAVAERVKVLFNKQYNNYVLLFHCDGPPDDAVVDWLKKGQGPYTGFKYYRASIGFAVSDSPFGPFKVVNVQRMHWVPGYYDASKGMARDMTAYIDPDDGKAYAIYSSEENQRLYVSRLSENYTTWDVPQGQAIEGVDFKARILESIAREAPIIFKYEGYYYLMTSGTTGWAPNEAKWHRATKLYGPYEEMGNPCEGPYAAKTFKSQGAHFIEYNPGKGSFIYFGDRWDEGDLPHSKYVWLPVELYSNHTFKLHNKNTWKLSDVFPDGPGPRPNLAAEPHNHSNSKPLGTLSIVMICCFSVFGVIVLTAVVVAIARRTRQEEARSSYDAI